MNYLFTQNDYLTVWIWLGIFAIGLVLSLFGLFANVIRRDPWSRTTTVLWYLAATIPVLAMIADMQQLSEVWLSGSPQFVAKLGLTFVLAATFLCLILASQVQGYWSQFLRGLGATAVLASVAWAGLRTQLEIHPTQFQQLSDETNLTTDLEESHIALTNLGTEIPLYRCVTSDHEPAAPPTEDVYSFEQRILKLSMADTASNCHGWVFAGGKYLLRGNDVQIILEDNDYCEVQDPQANDVIVYRDLLGNILHSGLVRYKDEAGQVFIESKWGVQGHYLHQPADQIYGPRYTYYRPSLQTQPLLVVTRQAAQQANLVKYQPVLPASKFHPGYRQQVRADLPLGLRK